MKYFSFFFVFFVFQVPIEFSFSQVFDLFFKIHHVFNVHYEDNLKNMMNFLQHFIYQIPGVVTPDSMKLIFQQLTSNWFKKYFKHHIQSHHRSHQFNFTRSLLDFEFLFIAFQSKFMWFYYFFKWKYVVTISLSWVCMLYVLLFDIVR